MTTDLSTDYYTYDSEQNTITVDLSQSFETATFNLTSIITATGEVVLAATGTIKVEAGATYEASTQYIFI